VSEPRPASLTIRQEFSVQLRSMGQ
jgi:hypothetical protein